MKKYNSNVRRFRIVSEPSILPKVKVTKSSEVYDWIKKMYDENKTDMNVSEIVYAIMLNNSNSIVSYYKLSEGGLTSSLIDIRLLMKFAINSLCTSMILVHNHPSGNFKPSNEDIKITEKIKIAGKTLDIKLLDHMIITLKRYYSMLDEGDI